LNKDIILAKLLIRVMAKVTSKLQLTLPKAIADRYKIRPGDDLEWAPAGEAIRVIKRNGAEKDEPATLKERLQLFDQATARQRKRQADSGQRRPADGSRTSNTGSRASSRAGSQSGRGWTREELYQRGLSR
jgi:bifunctional DNA-binding transcriptional regulator/antitoxin component of YhaV-PrlF toxin-antitoxin module